LLVTNYEEPSMNKKTLSLFLVLTAVITTNLCAIRSLSVVLRDPKVIFLNSPWLSKKSNKWNRPKRNESSRTRYWRRRLIARTKSIRKTFSKLDDEYNKLNSNYGDPITLSYEKNMDQLFQQLKQSYLDATFDQQTLDRLFEVFAKFITHLKSKKKITDREVALFTGLAGATRSKIVDLEFFIKNPISKDKILKMEEQFSTLDSHDSYFEYLEKRREVLENIGRKIRDFFYKKFDENTWKEIKWIYLGLFKCSDPDADILRAFDQMKDFDQRKDAVIITNLYAPQSLDEALNDAGYLYVDDLGLSRVEAVKISCKVLRWRFLEGRYDKLNKEYGDTITLSCEKNIDQLLRQLFQSKLAGKVDEQALEKLLETLAKFITQARSKQGISEMEVAQFVLHAFRLRFIIVNLASNIPLQISTRIQEKIDELMKKEFANLYMQKKLK